MTKSQAIGSLMDSATEAFSVFGFEGASLRDIARKARLPLSSIDRYFGSKAALYTEVERRAWRSINAERLRLLNEEIARARESNETLQLNAVLRALFQPVIRHAMGNSELRSIVRLLGTSCSARRQLGLIGPAHSETREMYSRWIEAVMQACPKLSPADAVWAYSFAVGALYSQQLLGDWYDDMVTSDEAHTEDRVTELLVAFCSAGILAVEQRSRP